MLPRPRNRPQGFGAVSSSRAQSPETHTGVYNVLFVSSSINEVRWLSASEVGALERQVQTGAGTFRYRDSSVSEPCLLDEVRIGICTRKNVLEDAYLVSRCSCA